MEQNINENKEVKKPSAVSVLLNKYFHHLDRGGSLKNEVLSGFLVGIIAVCALFMNMQAISATLVQDGMGKGDIANLYAGIYFASTLVACIGSLLIGLIARLPLVQCTGLSIGALFISTIGAHNGLTYYNLLAVCFVSAIVYTVLVSLPIVKKFVFKAIPKSVLKALPAAAGALLTFIALQLSGVITVQSGGININQFVEMNNVSNLLSLGGLLNSADYATDVYKPYVMLGVICAIVTVIGYIVFNGIKQRSQKHCQNPLWLALILGTVVYFVVAAITSFSQIINWGRLWMVGGQDAYMNHVLGGTMTLQIGKVFTEGFDFSAFTEAGGNVVSLFLGGILTYTFIGMFDAQSTLQAIASDIPEAEVERREAFDYKNEGQLAVICNAGMNLFASVMGVPPVSIGKESIAGSKNGAKSGIASVVASLVLLVSVFAWAIPFVFATFSATGNIALTGMYGHINSGALQATSYAAFCVVDMIMAIVGVSMVINAIKDFDWFDKTDAAVFVVTMLATLFLSNIAYGAAIGVSLYCLSNFMQIKKDPEGGIPAALKKIGIPTATLAVVMVLMLIFAL